jgi:hypothetical protein
MTIGTDEMENGSDRFGVDLELIGRIFRHHLEAGVIRCGCYVPTREEVATKPPEWLHSIVNDWFWESPEELAPDRGQVEDTLAILKARPDADHELIRAIIADAPDPSV